MGYFNVTEGGGRVIVSIVSHGQGKLVSALLEDLAHCSSVSAIIITQNIPEADIACPESLRSRVHLICNDQPRGFAANHNQAFHYCDASLFAVLNPDIRLNADPFPKLNAAIALYNAGVIAPAVRNPKASLEDSARHFPTLIQLFAKLLGLGDGRIAIHGQTPLLVDWTAGMFMVFRADAFRAIQGFDEGFFLYYEDVDICARLWKAGLSVVLHPGVSVVHAAQRASRRNLQYMMWHMFSMVRYFYKHAWRLPR